MKIQIFLHHGQHPDGILSWDGKWVTLFNLDIQYNYNIFAENN